MILDMIVFIIFNENQLFIDAEVTENANENVIFFFYKNLIFKIKTKNKQKTGTCVSAEKFQKIWLKLSSAMLIWPKSSKCPSCT